MMARAKSVVEEMNAALEADKGSDKVSLPNPSSEWIDSLDFDTLVAIKNLVNNRLASMRDEMIAKIKADTETKLSVLEASVTEVFGLSGATRAARAPSAPKADRVAQTPPEGAEIFRDPNDDTKIWWRGKRGQRPSYAPKD